MKGRVKLFEFNQEDDDVECEPYSEKDSDWAERVKKLIKIETPRLIGKEIKELVPAMKAADMNDAKI